LTDLAKTKVTGTIEVTTYTNDADFRDKLAKPDAKFDLVSVTDRVVVELIKAGSLATLPKSLLDGLPRPEPKYAHHYFDPDNAFTYPYGYTLLGYDYTVLSPSLKDLKPVAATSSSKPDAHPVPSLVPTGGPKSWKNLESSLHLISWPADPTIKETCQHFFTESKAPAEAKAIALAKVNVDFIDQLKSSLKPDPILPPEIIPGLDAHPDAPAPTPPLTPLAPPAAGPAPAPLPAPAISIIVLPTDGSLITLYSWAMIKDSPHLDAAQNFLQVSLAAENVARLDTENYLSVTSTAALKSLAPDVSKDPLLYPADAVLDHCEFIRPAPPTPNSEPTKP
jgi:hypothetical protein